MARVIDSFDDPHDESSTPVSSTTSRVAASQENDAAALSAALQPSEWVDSVFGLLAAASIFFSVALFLRHLVPGCDVVGGGGGRRSRFIRGPGGSSGLASADNDSGSEYAYYGLIGEYGFYRKIRNKRGQRQVKSASKAELTERRVAEVEDHDIALFGGAKGTFSRRQKKFVLGAR